MVSFERCQEQKASFTFQWFSNWEKSCKEVGTIWGHKKTKKGAFKILALQKIYKIYNAQFIGNVLISQKNIFQIHLLLKVSTFKTRIPDPGTARSMERSIFQPPLTQTPRFFLSMSRPIIFSCQVLHPHRNLKGRLLRYLMMMHWSFLAAWIGAKQLRSPGAELPRYGSINYPWAVMALPATSSIQKESNSLGHRGLRYGFLRRTNIDRSIDLAVQHTYDTNTWYTSDFVRKSSLFNVKSQDKDAESTKP